MATCSANTLLSNGKDFQKLSKRELQIVIAQLLCNLAAGDAAFRVGTGPPTGSTATSPPQYIDRNTGIMYYFYDSNWH